MTQVVVLSTIALWIAYDLYAYYTHRPTESDFIRGIAKKPSIPFSFGVLAGHWFFT